MKRTVRWLIGIVFGLYIGIIVLLNISFVQKNISTLVANELSSFLNTHVSIGNINIGFLNRIIIDDFLLEDRNQQELIKVSRLSAKFNLNALLQGKISIGSVQLFGFAINLEKEDKESETNLQFILDALKSDKESSPINLRVNSLLIRRGALAYHVRSEEETPGQFNPDHIELNNIVGNISLKALQTDSINAQIKRLSFNEKSGFELDKLSLKVIANDKKMEVDHFAINLPNTSFELDTIRFQYNNLDNIKNFADSVHFSVNTLPSHLTPKDFSFFFPFLDAFEEEIELGLEASGTINDLHCSQLFINANNHAFIRGEVSLQNLSNPEQAYIFADLSNISADKEGVKFLVNNFSRTATKVPPLLDRLGNLSFKGEIAGYFTDLVTYGLLRTDLGDIRTDLQLSSNREKEFFAFAGAIETEKFKLGELTADNKLGDIHFNLTVNGRKERLKTYPEVDVKGVVSTFTYSDYTYENITIDGAYNQGGFEGALTLDDSNGAIELYGAVNLSKQLPTFDFYATVRDLQPQNLNLTNLHEEAHLSLDIRANFTGSTIDNVNGEINIDSLRFNSPEANYFLPNFNVRAVNTSKENLLTVHSNFLDARIAGKYAFNTLPTCLSSLLHKYLPSLVSKPLKTHKHKNNFSFVLNIYDTTILETLIKLPIRLETQSTLSGYFNEESEKFSIEANFPKLFYKNRAIESGLLQAGNSSGKLDGHLRLTDRRTTGAVNLAVQLKAISDSIQTTLNWGNNLAKTYSGQLNTTTHFSRKTMEEHGKEMLTTEIAIAPTKVILNDSIWDIHPSKITLQDEHLTVSNFKFTHKDQFLHIDGVASKSITDTLKVDLNRINVGYVFDIVNIDDVDFKGEATGTAIATRLFDELPIMHTGLAVSNFTFNDGLLGDMNIYGEWRNDDTSIYLNAYMDESQEKGVTEVIGKIYPSAPINGLNLRIQARGTNIAFLNKYMSGIANNVQGRAYGEVQLFGPFSALNLEGELYTQANLGIDALETRFQLNDTLQLSTKGIQFKKCKIGDMEGHLGSINGALNYQHFKDLTFRFDINVDHMLLMDIAKSPDLPFYGHVYGTGNAILSGDGEGVTIDAGLTTNAKTNFVYLTNITESAASNQFISFKDKTPKRVQPKESLTTAFDFDSPLIEDEQESDLKLNLLIDITPDANLRVLLDPLSGDYMSGRGNGNLRVEYYNKEDVKLFGRYTVERGNYKLSIQDVIRKDFILKEGSSITFNGNPAEALLDVNAQHTVNSVSLNDLIPNGSSLTRQPNIKVNCLMNLSGVVLRPTIRLGIELPNEHDEVQAIVRNYISTEEQVNMQFLYLLGIGKFYTADNLGNNQNSDVMSSVLSSTLSGQLNNMLAQMINNNNWSFGTNLSTGNKGWTDVEVEGVLSGQLLNNRLLINGNFGYRDNPMANTNFIGDFEAEWLVNRSGEIRLKAYNRTNDHYYTRTNFTTQGIGILFRKDFTYWKELLFWNTIKARRKEKREKATLPHKELQETE